MKYFTFSNLGNAGRLGNQLFQVASTIGEATSKGGVPRFNPDWVYGRWFSLADSYYGAVPQGAEVTDLHGYMQELRFFEHIEDYIRAIFSPSYYASQQVHPLYDQYGYPENLLAVHVRCGDYIELQDKFYCLPAAYYARAIARARELAGRPLKICLFSDDPSLAVKRLQGVLASGEYCVAPSGGSDDDVLSLLLMRECQAHVIANSTYSWWGAWLSSNRRVMCPSKWGVGDFDFESRRRTIVPRGWEMIDAAG